MIDITNSHWFNKNIIKKIQRGDCKADGQVIYGSLSHEVEK